MQIISVNKKMDYSVPIFFIPTSQPTTIQSKPIPQKKTAPAVTKKPVQAPKATTLAATSKKTEVKPPKSTTITAAPKAKSPDLSAEALAKEDKKEKVVAVAPKKPEIKPEEKKIESSFAPPSPKATADLRKATADTAKKEEIAIPPSHKATADTAKIEPKTESPAPTPSPLAKALDIGSDIVPAQKIKSLPQIAPAAELPTNAQISNNYREVEALRRHAQLQKELVQKWHPPFGVSPDCSCEISFFVNNKGAIEDIKMMKSSGVTMFDISARQALFSMKMPQWTHGNPLVISFKQ